MIKRILPILLVALVICFGGCKKKSEVDRLKDTLFPLAKEYLKAEKIEHYDSLKIDCIDTLTELSYANLNIFSLEQMANSYEEIYNDAVVNNSNNVESIHLQLNEVNRVKADFEELIENGDLKTEGVLLFFVSGTYYVQGQAEPFSYFVYPDKKTLYTMDPFGDNLLYKDEQ